MAFNLLILLDQSAAAAAAGKKTIVASVAFDAVSAPDGAASGHLQETLEGVTECTEGGPAHALGRNRE